MLESNSGRGLRCRMQNPRHCSHFDKVLCDMIISNEPGNNLTITKLMKEKSQSLIFFVVLGVVGYFAYQYFIAPWLAGNSPTESNTGNYSLYLPEECQAEGESLMSAFYRHKELGNLTISGLSGFKRDYRQCLKHKADFTDSQINEALDLIRSSR